MKPLPKFTLTFSRKANRFTKEPGHTMKSGKVWQNLPAVSRAPSIKRAQHSTIMARGLRVLGGGAYYVGSLSIFLEEWQSTGTTSLSEGILYWALEKLLGPEGIQWTFQESRMGGRHRLGGAVVDFIIYIDNVSIGVRVQTYRFHQNVDPRKQAYDVEQFRALTGPRTIIIDVFESQYIDDPTGETAIKLMLEVINKRWRINPLSTGMVVGSG